MKPRERLKIQSEVMSMLETSQAVLRGHFIGTSGRHLDTYVNKDRLFTSPTAVNSITKGFARLARDKKAEGVVGPAIGGAILAQKTAEHLGALTKQRVFSVFTQKDDAGIQQLKRGYDKDVAGKRVIVVEDILTTGGSLKEVVDAVARAGGTVVGTYAIVNRDPVRANEGTIGAPLETLVKMDLKSYGEDEVPPELAKISIATHVGHGAAYLAGKNKIT